MQINPPLPPETSGPPPKVEPSSKQPPWLFPGLFFLGGIFADFLFVGVFKIIWIAIYGTSYVAIAMTIETMVARSRGKKVAIQAIINFLLGACLAHLIFVNHTQYKTYSMDMISENPLALKGSDFPEILYVTSDTLSQALKDQNLTTHIPMETRSDMDYGCAKNFAVTSIDHIDVMNDGQANWTFRKNAIGHFSEREVLPNDDDKLIWCRLVFYRN